MAAGLLGWEQGTPQEEGKQLGRQSMAGGGATLGLLIRRALHGDTGTWGHRNMGSRAMGSRATHSSLGWASLLQGLENQECGPGPPWQSWVTPSPGMEREGFACNAWEWVEKPRGGFPTAHFPLIVYQNKNPHPAHSQPAGVGSKSCWAGVPQCHPPLVSPHTLPAQQPQAGSTNHSLLPKVLGAAGGAVAAQGDPQPTGPFLRLELSPSEEHTRGDFGSPQWLWGQQRAKVSTRSEGVQQLHW